MQCLGVYKESSKPKNIQSEWKAKVYATKKASY